MSKQWDRLKRAADHLDRRLKGYDDQGGRDLSHRTIVHGDYKCENVVFDQDDANVAVYDF